MSCCGSELVNKLRRLQTRLAQKGNYLEAERTGRLADRAESATRRASTIVSRMDSNQRTAEKPADVERYYKDCMKKPPSTAKGREKEYCSRVAWQIYCEHKNPGHPGCTEYGRTKKSLPK